MIRTNMNTSNLILYFTDVAVKKSKERTKLLERKVKALSNKVRRQTQQINTLKSLLVELKEKQLLQAHPAAILEQCFDDNIIDVIRNEYENSSRHKKGRRYSEETKQFALTLHYYSPQAYEFCREKLSLPHSSSLEHWLSNITCEPGFLSNVIEEAAKSNIKDFSLVVDSMSLMKTTTYSNSQFSGYCDYGGVVAEESERLASEALVFLLVPLHYSVMKYPVGYFLVDKVNADIQTRLVQNLLSITAEKGVLLRNITSDGASANIAMFSALGADLEILNPKPYFNHPQLGHRVYTTLDICHMLKLGRNTLADYKELKVDGRTESIYWNHIVQLSSLQDDIGLHLGNKLSSQHVAWQKQKMKVKLAAQTFSRSVSDALEFLKQAEVPEFKKCSATIEFIRQVYSQNLVHSCCMLLLAFFELLMLKTSRSAAQYQCLNHSISIFQKAISRYSLSHWDLLISENLAPFSTRYSRDYLDSSLLSFHNNTRSIWV
jgi:hypothetical protein